MALPTWVIGFARPYAVRRAKKPVKVYWQALSCFSSVNDSKVHVAAEDEKKENLFSFSPQQRLIHQTPINLSFICRWGSQFAFAITKPLKVVYRRGSFTPVRRHFSTAIIKPLSDRKKKKISFHFRLSHEKLLFYVRRHKADEAESPTHFRIRQCNADPN